MNNTQHTLQAAGTVVSATGSLGELDMPAHKGVRYHVKVTAKSGTNPTLDLKAQTYDSGSGDWVDITGASLAQITNTISTKLLIYPGVAESANLKVSDTPGRRVRLLATIGGTATPTFTLSLSAERLI